MDKRDCRRKIKRLNISFSDGTTGYNGISSDFSCNGLFIRTRNGFRAGTIIKMIFEVDDKTISMTGVVARSVKPGITTIKFGMGIEITATHPVYDNLISELYGSC